MIERTLLNKLALERCEFHLSQLCAVAHSFQREKGDLDRMYAGNFFNIVKAMNEDLKILQSSLGVEEGISGDEMHNSSALKVIKNEVEWMK